MAKVPPWVWSGDSARLLTQNILVSGVTVSATELGYLDGVTSAIQTQIDSKTGIADNETITGNWTFNNIITGSITGNAGTVTNGVYTTGDQSIAGIKTFSSTIVGSISGNAGTVTNGVYTTGDQSIAGIKTFASTIVGSISGNAGTVTNGAYINVTNSFTSTQNILATTNQLVLGTTNTTTISATAPAASRVYTMPDVGDNADFVMTAGAQTIGGAKTFTTASTTSNFIPANTGEFLIGNPTGTAGRISLSLRNQTAQPARLYSFVPSTDSAETNPALNFVAASTDGSSFSSITTERTRLFGFFNGNTAVTFVNADGTWNFINNVGIGTASPTNKMQIVGVNGAVTASAISGGLTISSAVGGNGLFSAGIGFSMQANQDQGRSGIVGYQDGTDVDVMGLKFLTHPGTLSSQDSIVAMTISPAGAVTLGPSSGTAVSHTVQGNSTDGTLRIKAGSFSGHIALQRETTSTGTVWLGSANGDFRIGTTAGGTDIGQATTAGAWTLGPSSGGASNLAHLINGYLTIDNGNAPALFVDRSTANTSATSHQGWLRDGVQIASVRSNGQFFATVTSIGTESDVSLKEKIQELSGSLAKINQLKPSTWTWVDARPSENVGFIAQEIETVFPELVSWVNEEETIKGVSASGNTMVAHLVKAIQELHAELQTLKGA